VLAQKGTISGGNSGTLQPGCAVQRNEEVIDNRIVRSLRDFRH
jgi:hypothetical protein